MTRRLKQLLKHCLPLQLTPEYFESLHTATDSSLAVFYVFMDHTSQNYAEPVRPCQHLCDCVVLLLFEGVLGCTVITLVDEIRESVTEYHIGDGVILALHGAW